MAGNARKCPNLLPLNVFEWLQFDVSGTWFGRQLVTKVDTFKYLSSQSLLMWQLWDLESLSKQSMRTKMRNTHNYRPTTSFKTGLDEKLSKSQEKVVLVTGKMWITFPSGSVPSLRAQRGWRNTPSTWLARLAPRSNLQILIGWKIIIKASNKKLVSDSEFKLLCFLDSVYRLGMCAKVHRLGRRHRSIVTWTHLIRQHPYRRTDGRRHQVTWGLRLQNKSTPEKTQGCFSPAGWIKQGGEGGERERLLSASRGIMCGKFKCACVCVCRSRIPAA